MIVSRPFWAFVLLSFGGDWFWLFLMTGVPKYMNQVLGFTIDRTSQLASIQYVANILGSILFGPLGDYLRRRQIMSVIGIRKSFVVFCECQSPDKR